MSLLAGLEQRVRENGGLIVSCQPVPGIPMDKPEIVTAMAQAGADISEGVDCHQKGVEFIGTTLSGDTGPTTPVEPDLAMVAQRAIPAVVLLPRGATTLLLWQPVL